MKRICYIFSLALLLFAGCTKFQLDEPVAPSSPEGIKVPISTYVRIPTDGPSTKAMADNPQIKNIVVVVFGSNGYFSEWVRADAQLAEYNYADYPGEDHDFQVYKVDFSLTVSESRLRLHFIANCPDDMLTNPPITGISSQDLEDILMSKVRSQIGEENNDGYWAKLLLPYGVQIETEVLNGVEQPVMVGGKYVPTTLTKSQFERFNPAGIPFIRNFARIYLHNGTTDWTIQKFALAYAPAEGPIAPILSSAYTADKWGEPITVIFDGADEDHDGDPVDEDGNPIEEFFYESFFIHYGYSDIQDGDAKRVRTIPELAAAPYNYVGYSPGNLQLGTYPASDTEMTTWAEGTPLYVYERAKPRTGQKATRILVKAYETSKGASTAQYYPLDLVDSNGEHLALLRNFTYNITLTGIADGSGKATIAEAADATSANVSADPKTQDLNEVSDGVASIAVSYIDATYIKTGTYDVMFRFVSNVKTGTEANNQVSLVVGYDNRVDGFKPNVTSANGSAFASDGTPTIEKSNGTVVLYVKSGNDYVVATAANGLNDPNVQKWGKITYTTTSVDKNNASAITTAGNFTKSFTQTIRVIGQYGDSSNPTSIYRDVQINLTPLKTMTVECLDKYVEEKAGTTETVRVYIPADLSRSMFPLQFKLESSTASLNPGLGQNMPVGSGPSLSGGSTTVYYFIKTLTRDDYNTLQTAADGTKYFDCVFTTIRDHSECTVYVANEYFTTASDSFLNYTQRFFTDVSISSTRAVGDAAYLSFTMDAAHSSKQAIMSHDANDNVNANAYSADYRVIPKVITLTFTGLTPQTYSDGTLVDRNLQKVSNNVYTYSPASESVTTVSGLSLTVTADEYVVKLSTDRLPSVKTLYQDFTIDNLVHYTVTLPESQSISLSGGAQTIVATVTANGATASPSVLTWSSSAESVATVSGGAVTPRSEGTTTIRATAPDGAYAECVVTVVSNVTVSFPINDWGNNNNDRDRTFTSDPVTLQIQRARGYGTYIQFGNNATVTVSTSGNKLIKKITINTRQGAIQLANNQSGSYSAGTWTGSATSVQFRATQNNTQITSIVVEYAP